MVADLIARMKQLETLAPTGSRWDHCKGGRYVVVGYCLLEATATPAILYALDEPEAPIWARDAGEFLDGRFTPVKATAEPVSAIRAEVKAARAAVNRQSAAKRTY